MNPRASISPAAVARSFSSAAETYDQYAELQRDVVNRLMRLVKNRKRSDTPEMILNFGSGTGYCSEQLESNFPDARVINLDIAEGMLRYHAARSGSSSTDFVCADVSLLPFTDNSFDLVFSSLALQWCPEVRVVFNELNRVCRPAGSMFISTLGPETLNEVRLLWQGIDENQHVNDFPDRAYLKSAAEHTGLELKEITEEIHVRKYLSLREMGRELRGLGASNKNAHMSRGLMGRNKLRLLEQRFNESCKKGWFRSGFNVYLMNLEVPK